MAQVAYTQSALRDVLGIFQVIAAEAGVARAVAFDRKFEDIFERLAAYPLAYPQRPSFGVDVRSAPARPYVILHAYDRGTDTVTVLRVLHGRRQIASDFMDLP